MPKIKHHLPLLSILQKMRPSDRQILVDHLDKDACDTIHYCLKKVLDAGKKKKKKSKHISKLVRENQKDIEDILGLNGKKKRLTYKQKRLALAKLGGNPLALILSSAVPLLLNMLKK